MGQFSVEKPALPGSVLSGNQQRAARSHFRPDAPEFRVSGNNLRIPTKPAMHSNMKPATYSDLKPAGVPI
jgi:hypothetical protein